MQYLAHMLQSSLFPLNFLSVTYLQTFFKKIFLIELFNNFKDIHFTKNKRYIYKQVLATCVTFHEWKNLFVDDSVSEDPAAPIALMMEVAGTLLHDYKASKLRRQQSS